MRVRVNGYAHPIALSAHAIDRFVERVRPTLGREDAGVELARLLKVCGVVGPEPEWISFSWEGRHIVGWVFIGDDIALPLDQQHRAVTVLCRGHISDEARKYRQQNRRRHPGMRVSKDGAERRPGRDDRPRRKDWAA